MDPTPPSLPPENGENPALFAAAAAPDPEPAWVNLDERGLLRVEGDDAETFLQGQLTQDMVQVRDGAALLAAHCSAKGRVTALFRTWHDGQAFLLDVPGDVAAAAQRRLGMYVLRARASLSSVAAAWMRTGVQGAVHAERIAALGLVPPDEAGAVARAGAHTCIALGAQRWMVVSPAGHDGGLRARFAEAAREDRTAWQLGAVRAGLPDVTGPAVDVFIPQMLNLDQLGGISFRKGCYTGQEIVARAHYLGRVKRRMQRFAWRGGRLPDSGSLLPIADGEAGAQAQVVMAVALGADHGEALAVGTVADAAAPAAGDA